MEDEVKNPYEEQNLQLDEDNRKLQSQADGLSGQMSTLANQPSMAYDSFSKLVEEQKASMETPEEAEKRKRDQRNAAMWTAVTDGIGQIFQLTHAASNPNAVPMQAVSTSAAVQQAAEKADERYEKQKEKLDQLRIQMAGIGDKDRQTRLQNIRAQHSDLQNRIKQNQEQRRYNDKLYTDLRKEKQTQKNFEAELEFKKGAHKDTMSDHAANRANQREINTANNESQERRAETAAEAKKAEVAVKAQNQANKKPSKEKNDAAYAGLTPEQKKAVDNQMSRVLKEAKGKPIGNDEWEKQRQAAIEQAGRSGTGDGKPKPKGW